MGNKCLRLSLLALQIKPIWSGFLWKTILAVRNSEEDLWSLWSCNASFHLLFGLYIKKGFKHALLRPFLPWTGAESIVGVDQSLNILTDILLGYLIHAGACLGYPWQPRNPIQSNRPRLFQTHSRIFDRSACLVLVEAWDWQPCWARGSHLHSRLF